MFFKLDTWRCKLRLSCLFTMLLLMVVSAPSYAIKFNVEGVENSEITENIQLFAKQVSVPATEFEVDEYTVKLSKAIEKAVQAYAYYDAKITIAPISYTEDQNFTVNISLSLNQKTMVQNVVLVNDLAQFTAEQNQHLPKEIKQILEQVKAMQGKALDHKAYENLKNRLRVFSSLYGYFEFDFIVHKLLILPSNQGTDNPGHKAIIHWIFNLGERYVFGDLIFLQDTRGQEIAKQVKPFKSGDYFEQSKIGEFSIKMASTGYFDNAFARANTERATEKKVPIEVLLKPKPKDLYKFGVGFSTDTKARLSADWERPWVNLDGHTLGASLYLSNPRKSLSADYRIPKANPLNDFLNYRVSFKQADENQTKSDTLAFEVQRQWGAKEEQDWDKIAFLSAERETFIQGQQAEETVDLLMPGFTFNRTRKQGDIFVDWGDRQQLTIQGASKSLLSDIDFFKVLARTKWIREYGIHRFTVRADVGAIATNDFDLVPSSQRFFAGGDQSIRGFSYNGLSDFRIIEVDGVEKKELLGGKYLSVASVEYAFKVAENWRAAVFFDAGNASNKFADDIAKGYGIGGHWLSPIGNVQIYIARGEARIDNEWRLHLIIGPGL